MDSIYFSIFLYIALKFFFYFKIIMKIIKKLNSNFTHISLLTIIRINLTKLKNILFPVIFCINFRIFKFFYFFMEFIFFIFV